MIGRRGLLLLAGSLAAIEPAEACTLVATRRPTAADVHSDKRARVALRGFVAMLNSGTEPDDGRPRPTVHFDTSDQAGDREFPAGYLSSADKRDGGPAKLGLVTMLAAGRYTAAYLGQIVRDRVYFPAQDGSSCGPYDDSYDSVTESWLFRFDRNRLTDARRLAEFDDDYRALVS